MSTLTWNYSNVVFTHWNDCMDCPQGSYYVKYQHTKASYKTWNRNRQQNKIKSANFLYSEYCYIAWSQLTNAAHV